MAFSGNLHGYANGTKKAVLALNGGILTANGTVTATFVARGCTVDFQSAVSTFKATFGGAFGDIAAVNAAFGTVFINNTGGTKLHSEGVGSGRLMVKPTRLIDLAQRTHNSSTDY